MRNKRILPVIFIGIILCPGGLQSGKIAITRERADELLARVPKGDPWEEQPDGSTLAWGESALLRTLANLYEATDDPKYLNEVARRGEQLLSHRDDRRGVVDCSGKSRPAWSMGLKFVVAEGQLTDESGKLFETG